MTLVQQNLRSDILRSPANRVGSLGHNLGESIVDELEITVVCNHDILWLEVTIANVPRVKVLKDAGNLCAIKGRMTTVEVSYCAMVSEQVTATQELSSEVNVTIVLEKSIIIELFKWKRQQRVSSKNLHVDLHRRGDPSWRGYFSRSRCDQRVCSE